MVEEIARLDQRIDEVEGSTIPALSERVRRLELRILIYLPIAITVLDRGLDVMLPSRPVAAAFATEAETETEAEDPE